MSEIESLVEGYVALHTTVDRIAASAELRKQLRDLLPETLKKFDDDEIVRKLMNLRKSGKLPKQFRGV